MPVRTARRFTAYRPALTADGHRMLADRARSLRDERLPELRPLLVEWERDERAVAEFERVQAELDRLERLLAESEVLDDGLRRARRVRPGQVCVGARVVVESPDLERETVRIVHPAEAFLDDERISVTSPLARALLGARVGDTVWIDAPVGAWPARVVDVRVDTEEAGARGSVGGWSPNLPRHRGPGRS